MSGRFGYDQTKADVDDLEGALETIDPDQRVALTWRSNRASGEVTVEGVAVEDDDSLFRMGTSERKGDLVAQRRGDFEISIVSTGSTRTNRTVTVGWLVDVAVLEKTEP